MRQTSLADSGETMTSPAQPVHTETETHTWSVDPNKVDLLWQNAKRLYGLAAPQVKQEQAFQHQ